MVAHERLQPVYDWEGYGFETRQVHAGEVEEPGFGARIPPIHLTAAYRFDSFQQSRDRFAGTDDGQLYSRNLNPTQAVAERRIASLEGGVGAIAVGSGQAAIASAVIGLIGAGGRLVSTASIYSGTRLLFDRTLGGLGIGVDYVWDPGDETEWERRIGPATRAIFTESIPNPKNDVVDLRRVAAVAERHGLPLIVDNTIATPYLARPIAQGANIVVHSSTKFLTGHGAALSGVIVDGGSFDWAGSPHRYPAITEPTAAGGASLLEARGRHALEHHLRWGPVNDLGPALSPVNAFLLQQGIETLSLRMERHLANSATIARWLSEHPAVAGVDYAGLPGSPFHEIARRTLDGPPGSVFAFTLHGGLAAAESFIDSLRVFSRMTNIGDVRSMALHPATTTHLPFDQETRDRLGIGDGLIRLSVGIETVDDLVDDLDGALRRAATRCATRLRAARAVARGRGRTGAAAMNGLTEGFTAAFRGHPAGVAIVTAGTADGPVGLTASSVASVSAEPPVLSFSVAKTDGSAGGVLDAETILVHLLGHAQAELARSFAVSGAERFTPAQGWRLLPSGEPHLPGAPFALRARIIEVVEVGRSRLILAEILGVHEGPASARLIYQHRRFHPAPDHDSPPVGD